MCGHVDELACKKDEIVDQAHSDVSGVDELRNSGNLIGRQLIDNISPKKPGGRP